MLGCQDSLPLQPSLHPALDLAWRDGRRRRDMRIDGSARVVLRLQQTRHQFWAPGRNRLSLGLQPYKRDEVFWQRVGVDLPPAAAAWSLNQPQQLGTVVFRNTVPGQQVGQVSRLDPGPGELDPAQLRRGPAE